MGATSMTNVKQTCRPRKEVLKGDLQDAIFAADFGDLIAGKAPDVYGKPDVFFQNTHPAKQLCEVVRAVFTKLSDTKEVGATVRLSTGFGGGKSHTLMVLWHLAQNIQDPSLGTEILPAAGRPTQVKVVAVDAYKAGVPEFARHGSTIINSLWGEIFFQFAGKDGLKALGQADSVEASPSEDQVLAIFPKKGPVLILLDELVVYMARVSERGQGNVLGFVNTLASVASKRPQTVLIVTDPADQRAYAPQAAQFNAQLATAAIKLDEVLSRKVSDFDPIGGESAQVIVRRLFEHIDKTAAQKTSAEYHSLYTRVSQEKPGLIPPEAIRQDYAQAIVTCYPFHPRLLDTAQGRLRALQNFHQSRGVLRLFARIIRDVWESKADYELIGAGDINWSSSRIQADLLQRLNRDNFKAAINADIEKHAVELDNGVPGGIHQRVASALLLESIPLDPNSGLDHSEITLATLRPDEAGPEPSEAIDRLYGTSWHIYPLPSGRGYQFRYDPNVNKQIEERMGKVSIEDARGRVLAEVQGYFSGPGFKLASWPQNARQVPNNADLQLALCDDEAKARLVCACEDDSNPERPMPRQFINAIVAITANPSALSAAVERAQRMLAADQILEENKSGESGKLVREQLKTILPRLQKDFRIQACRAFDRVVLPGGTAYSIEEKYQVSDEDVLAKPRGQECLRRFLNDKGLIYQPGDSLDVERFLRDVLPGATPVAGQADAFSAKAVHERFLSTPKMRLVPSPPDVVRETIRKAVQAGKLAIQFEDGRAYDQNGCVQGPPGKRRRIAGSPDAFTLSDKVLVAPVGSAAAQQWLKEDAIPKPGGAKDGEIVPPPPPPPPSTSKITVQGWEKIREHAANRPLLSLRLTARTPSAAATLLVLAQPLGAESLASTISVNGPAKDGGHLHFAATDVKPAHPTKPMAIAQTLFNALADGQAQYEADIRMSFGPDGRAGMDSQLENMADNASADISPMAEFGKPLAGGDA